MPLKPSHFLPAICEAYPETEKEGLAVVWETFGDLTGDAVRQTAEGLGLRVMYIGATVEDLRVNLEEYYIQYAENF